MISADSELEPAVGRFWDTREKESTPVRHVKIMTKQALAILLLVRNCLAFLMTPNSNFAWDQWLNYAIPSLNPNCPSSLEWCFSCPESVGVRPHLLYPLLSPFLSYSLLGAPRCTSQPLGPAVSPFQGGSLGICFPELFDMLIFVCILIGAADPVWQAMYMTLYYG